MMFNIPKNLLRTGDYAFGLVYLLTWMVFINLYCLHPLYYSSLIASLDPIALTCLKVYLICIFVVFLFNFFKLPIGAAAAYVFQLIGSFCFGGIAAFFFTLSDSQYKNIIYANFQSYYIYDPWKSAIDYIQRMEKCCGAIDPSDWNSSTWYKGLRNKTFSNAPVSCCMDEFPNCGLAFDVDVTSNLHEEGCLFTVYDIFNTTCIKYLVITTLVISYIALFLNGTISYNECCGGKPTNTNTNRVTPVRQTISYNNSYKLVMSDDVETKSSPVKEHHVNMA